MANVDNPEKSIFKITLNVTFERDDYPLKFLWRCSNIDIVKICKSFKQFLKKSSRYLEFRFEIAIFSQLKIMDSEKTKLYRSFSDAVIKQGHWFKKKPSKHWYQESSSIIKVQAWIQINKNMLWSKFIWNRLNYLNFSLKKLKLKFPLGYILFFVICLKTV